MLVMITVCGVLGANEDRAPFVRRRVEEQTAHVPDDVARFGDPVVPAGWIFLRLNDATRCPPLLLLRPLEVLGRTYVVVASCGAVVLPSTGETSAICFLDHGG